MKSSIIQNVAKTVMIMLSTNPYQTFSDDNIQMKKPSFHQLNILRSILRTERWNASLLIIDPETKWVHTSDSCYRVLLHWLDLLWISCRKMMIIVSWVFWSSFQWFNDHACDILWSCFLYFVDHCFDKNMIIVPKRQQKITK